MFDVRCLMCVCLCDAMRDARCDCESGGCAGCGECASFLGIRFVSGTCGLVGFGMGIWEDERTDYFSLAFFSFSRTSVLDALRLSSQPLSSPTPTPFPFHPSSRSRSPHFHLPNHRRVTKKCAFSFSLFSPFCFFIAFHNCCPLFFKHVSPRSASAFCLLASFISKNVRFAFRFVPPIFCAFVLL